MLRRNIDNISNISGSLKSMGGIEKFAFSRKRGCESLHINPLFVTQAIDYVMICNESPMVSLWKRKEQ